MLIKLSGFVTSRICLPFDSGHVRSSMNEHQIQNMSYCADLKYFIFGTFVG
jgi:hypothetical protein